MVGCRYRHLKQPELELIQIIPPNRNYTDMALLDVCAPLVSQSCNLSGALSTAHGREMLTPALAGIGRADRRCAAVPDVYGSAAVTDVAFAADRIGWILSVNRNLRCSVSATGCRE